GADAVVGSDLPPYSVAVGNPAKVIRKRFDDEMIELLEMLQWWNRSEKQIQKLIPILSNPDIEQAKEQIKAFLSRH
ncbi:MAG: chloramphenicol acetyltransferase, partial [Bacilli bacterium]|nr:chloramphenicol acetyltransferase [Bacilli bacterium]